MTTIEELETRVAALEARPAAAVPSGPGEAEVLRCCWCGHTLYEHEIASLSCKRCDCAGFAETAPAPAAGGTGDEPADDGEFCLAVDGLPADGWVKGLTFTDEPWTRDRWLANTVLRAQGGGNVRPVWFQPPPAVSIPPTGTPPISVAGDLIVDALDDILGPCGDTDAIVSSLGLITEYEKLQDRENDDPGGYHFPEQATAAPPPVVEQPAPPPIPPTGSPDGASLIAAERARQIGEEGWTREHDGEHENRELAEAASAYLGAYLSGDNPSKPPREWPWESEAWKPADPERMLVKAGALIAAELDRVNWTAPSPVVEQPEPAAADGWVKGLTFTDEPWTRDRWLANTVLRAQGGGNVRPVWFQPPPASPAPVLPLPDGRPWLYLDDAQSADAIWGEGNWVRCSRCKSTHSVEFHNAAPLTVRRPTGDDPT